MQDLIDILNFNNIKYSYGKYGYTEDCIIIRGNHYQIEIYKDKNGYVSDLQEIPYNWGRMGLTTLNDIIDDLRKFLKINITVLQLSLF